MGESIDKVSKTDDLNQVLKNLIDKCAVEEAEYRRTLLLLKKYRHALFWFVVWFVLVCVVIGMGHGTPAVWAMAAYLAVLLIMAVYILLSMKSISSMSIEKPEIRHHELQDGKEVGSEQVEEMFEYYYAIDKRNDKVSTTTTVAGSVMGVGTLMFVVALVVFFCLGTL